MPEDIQLSAGLENSSLSQISQQIGNAVEAGARKGMGAGISRGLTNLGSINENHFTRPLGSIRGSLGEFTKSMEAANARVIAFGASAGSFYLVQKAIKETVLATIEVDKHFRSINAIIGTSASAFEKFGDSLFGVARDTGRSFQDVAAAAEELARQGLGAEQTLQRTKDAMILARTSGMQVVDAVEAITAALNSFNSVGLTSTQLINKLVAVDANFAVSSGDLAEAVKRVGSSATDAGVGLDELIAAVTAAQQTTARGGAVIGNSFKTIFTRVQRPQVVEALENLGVETRKANGELLSAIDILGNLSRSYDTLGQAQRSQVAELVGGVFQVNVLKATLKDLGKEYGVYSNALKISNEATDEASKRNEELNQSLSAVLNAATVNITKFAAGFGKSNIEPALRKILDLFNQITESSLSDTDKGFFKVFGDFFSGPGLAIAAKAIHSVASQFIKFFGDAVVTVSGLAKEQEKVNLLQQQYTTLISKSPEILKQIEAGTLNQIELNQTLNSVIERRLDMEAKIAQVAALSARSSAAAGYEVNLSHGPGQGLITKSKYRASGYIPEMIERSAAIAGGYTPGNVRSMAVPGEGGVYYNDAETVKKFPGMSGPAIMPPEDSPAGKSYRRQFEKQNGFNPYKADGLVPEKYRGIAAVTGASVASSIIGTQIGGKAGDAINNAGNIAASTYYLFSSFNNKWSKGTIALLGGIYGVTTTLSTLSRSGDSTREALENAKESFQKTSDGLGVYQQKLGDLTSAYASNKVSTESIINLQKQLADSLQNLPEDIRRQVLGATSGEQLGDITAKITEAKKKELKRLEVAAAIENRLGGMMFGRQSSIYDAFQKDDSKKVRLGSVAANIFSTLDKDQLIKEVRQGKDPFASGGLGGLVSRYGGGAETAAAAGQIRGESLADLRKKLTEFSREAERANKIYQVTLPLREKENATIEKYSQAMRVAEQRASFAGQNVSNVGAFQNVFNTQRMSGQAGLLLETARGGLNAGRSLMSESLVGKTEYGLDKLSTNQTFVNSASKIYDSAAEKISEIFSKNLDSVQGGANAPKIIAARSSFASLVNKPGNTLQGLGEGALGILKTVNRQAEGQEIYSVLADSNKELIKLVQETQHNFKINELQYRVSQESLNIQKNSKLGGGIESLLNPESRSKARYGISDALSELSGGSKGKGAVELAQRLMTYGGVSASNPDIDRLRAVAIGEQKKNLKTDLSDVAEQLQRAGFGAAAKEIRGRDINEAAQTSVLGAIPAGSAKDLPKSIQDLLSATNDLVKLQSAAISGGRYQEMSSAFKDALEGSTVGKALEKLSAEQIGYQVAQAILKTKQGEATARIQEAVEGVKAFGNVPQIERSLAAAGGYTAGSIKRLGNITYNSAESVVNIPGFSEPFINPPANSKAGMMHRQKSMALTGIDPYAAFGKVPNFAAAGPSIANIDPKIAEFYANYGVNEASGRFFDKRTGRFISLRKANELQGRRIFEMGGSTELSKIEIARANAYRAEQARQVSGIGFNLYQSAGGPKLLPEKSLASQELEKIASGFTEAHFQKGELIGSAQGQFTTAKKDLALKRIIERLIKEKPISLTGSQRILPISRGSLSSSASFSDVAYSMGGYGPRINPSQSIVSGLVKPSGPATLIPSGGNLPIQLPGGGVITPSQLNAEVAGLKLATRDIAPLIKPKPGLLPIQLPGGGVINAAELKQAFPFGSKSITPIPLGSSGPANIGLPPVGEPISGFGLPGHPANKYEPGLSDLSGKGAAAYQGKNALKSSLPRTITLDYLNPNKRITLGNELLPPEDIRLMAEQYNRRYRKLTPAPSVSESIAADINNLKAKLSGYAGGAAKNLNRLGTGLTIADIAYGSIATGVELGRAGSQFQQGKKSEAMESLGWAGLHGVNLAGAVGSIVNPLAGLASAPLLGARLAKESSSLLRSAYGEEQAQMSLNSSDALRLAKYRYILSSPDSTAAQKEEAQVGLQAFILRGGKGGRNASIDLITKFNQSRLSAAAPATVEQMAYAKRANKDIDLKNTLSTVGDIKEGDKVIGNTRFTNPLSYFGSLRSNIAAAQDFETKRALQRELYESAVTYRTNKWAEENKNTNPVAIANARKYFQDVVYKGVYEQDKSAELKAAVDRESSALRGRGVPNPKSFMYIDSSPRINENPEGLGVFNSIDEPNGPFAAGGRIPNFAAAPTQNTNNNDLIYKVVQLMEELKKLSAAVDELVKKDPTNNTSKVNLDVYVSGQMNVDGTAKEIAKQTADAVQMQLRKEIDAVANSIGAPAKVAVAGARGV